MSEKVTRMPRMKVPFRRILLLLALLLFFSGLILLSVYLKDVATYQKAVKDTVFSGVEIAGISCLLYGLYLIMLVMKTVITKKTGFFFEGKMSNTLMDERYQANRIKAEAKANKIAHKL